MDWSIDGIESQDFQSETLHFVACLWTTNMTPPLPQPTGVPSLPATNDPRIRRKLGKLVSPDRNETEDRHLALILAAVAGAANAGGFFAVGQYTSHMTGYLAQLADNIAVANLWAAFVCSLALASFVSGAGFSAILINWAQQHRSHHKYAMPIALQGAFLFCFSWGWIFSSEAGRLFSLACLCFIMGMENATITRISGARIRTTHATGMITDIGIEIGKAFYGLLRPASGVAMSHKTFRVLVTQVGAFVSGGVIGALGFGHFGFLAALPLAFILLAISLPALLFDHPDTLPPDTPPSGNMPPSA